LSGKVVSLKIRLGGEGKNRVFLLKKSSKYWLWGSVCILLVNIAFFMFRSYVAEAVLLWIIILTPVACMMLYPLARLLDKDRTPTGEKNA